MSFCQNELSKTHKLIIGDNYDALLNLSISYKNKIDVIYIDPPYGKDDMGEFAETNYNNAITRDNLLSMLYPRLILARQLLTDEGVIFCSIDDRNQAYVKCLFDEIFGEKNFIVNMVWKSKSGGGNDSKKIAIDHEYVLVYSKDQNSVEIKLDKNAIVTTNYAYTDEKGNYSRDRLDKQSLGYQESLDFPIVGTDGKVYTVEHKDPQNKVARWRWSEETVAENYEDLIFDYPYVYTKNYEKEAHKPRSLMIDERFGRTRTGGTLLKSILRIKKFQYPKSVQMMKYLIEISSNPNSIVLDFFSGSGTTGQAVLELNKEDGGNRTFILCTNNEKTDMNPKGIAIDVTSKRLKRVMTGSCYDGTNDFEWIKKNSPLGDNLDVYEIAEVSNSEQSDGKSAFDVIDENLYGELKLTPKDKIKWVCENFSVTQKYLEDKQ